MKKILSTFAPELTMGTSIKALFIAAFFILSQTNSLGCCYSSDSCLKALLTFPNIKREQQSFLFLNIFIRQMGTSVKKCSTGKNSTLNRRAYETGAKVIAKSISSSKEPDNGNPAETILSSKKVCKKFVDSKTCCKFVASIPQTVFLASKSVAVFFAAKLGYQIPLGCCTLMSVIVCGRTGGDSLSIFKHFNFFVQ